MAAITALLDLAGALGFVAVAVFVRLGAALFLLPGAGERAIPARVRLLVALALTPVLAPLVLPLAGAPPETPSALAAVIVGEAASGLLIGLAFRLAVFVLQTAGWIAAQHISLAQMFGAGVAPEPEPTLATLLGMGGVVLALEAGLHLRLVALFAELYDALPFGRVPVVGDLAAWSVAQVASVFALAFSLALPFVAVSFAYNVALGALSRAMPQLLVALVGAPLLVGLGLGVLWLVLPELFARWGEVLGDLLADPLGGLR